MKSDEKKGENSFSTSLTELTNRIERQLNKDIDFYITSLNEFKLDDWTSMIYPPIFGGKDIKTVKEGYIEQKSQGLLKTIDFKGIQKIHPMKTIDGKHFVYIEGTGDVRLNIKGPSAEKFDYFKSIFELSYDTKASEVNNEAGFVIIKNAPVDFIAISDEGSNYLWKYIEIDKRLLESYNRIIPEEFLNQI